MASPRDADIGIWNKIKENGDIGYFTQNAEFVRGRYHTTDEQNQFIGKIQDLIEENPASIYAKELQESLDSNLAKISAAAKDQYGRSYFNEAMSVKIVTDRSEYFQSEPIGVICRFSNDTIRPQTTVLPDFSSESQLLVDLGSYRRPLNQLLKTGPPRLRRPVTFQPRVEFEEAILLDTNLDEMFPHPGTFTIQMSLLTLQGMTLESNPVQITIKEPVGHDKDALDFIKRHRTDIQFPTLFGWWGHVKLDGRHTILEQFVNEYGESVYGELAALRLATYYLSRYEKAMARPLLEKAARSNNSRIAIDAKYWLQNYEKSSR